MSEGFNRVILFGNLGADPEYRVTAGGTPLLKMRVATSEKYKDRAGVLQERTEWHSVAVWGRRAEGLNKFLAKGMSVLVEGSLRTSSYEDRDGNKRYKTEIHAQNIVVGGRGRGPSGPPEDDFGAPGGYGGDPAGPGGYGAGPRGGGGGYQQQSAPRPPAGSPPPPPDVPPEDDGFADDDKIPF